jgi:hypothetical protein
VRLANDMLTEVRQHATRDVRGRRGRKRDPEWAGRRKLLIAHERLDPMPRSSKLWNSLIDAGDPGIEILHAYTVKENLRHAARAVRDQPRTLPVAAPRRGQANWSSGRGCSTWSPAAPGGVQDVAEGARRGVPQRVEVATLDPFHGYKNAIDDQLEDARSVLDAFHVVKLATQVVDDVRRRVQQEIHGHRGRKNDPLYRIRNILRAGAENLTDRQRARLEARRGPPTNDTSRSKSPGVRPTGPRRLPPGQPRRRTRDRREGPRLVPTCPIPEVKRLGKTLTQWRREFLGYFDTGGASNGGTEAVNGLIELHRRIARGFRNRDNYRLRMLLIGGGLEPMTPHSSV